MQIKSTDTSEITTPETRNPPPVRTRHARMSIRFLLSDEHPAETTKASAFWQTPGQASKKPRFGATPEEQRERAAIVLQAAARGWGARRAMAREAQQETPYKTAAQFRFATNAYAPAVLKERPPGSALRNAEVSVYATVAAIPDGQPALLHSFQRGKDLEDTCKQINAPRDGNIGNIYNPMLFGGHDMRVNAAWLLGIAHFRKIAVLTTKLDDATLVRQSAMLKPAEERTTEKNLSALAREVLGMVQNDYFVPFDAPCSQQILMPTPLAKQATLEGFKTPTGMPKQVIRDILEEKGIDVSGISASAPAPLPDKPEGLRNCVATNTYEEI